MHKIEQKVKKNKRQRGQGAMIKILVGIILCLFLVQFASAELFTFDNVVDYSQDEMKATIINFFGLGGTIGSAELKSHNYPEEIRYIIAGKNKTVMWYEFSNWNDIYINGLGNVEFINLRNGQKINKDYYFAYAVYEEVDVPELEKKCGLEIREGETVNICKNVVKGTHKEKKIIRWEKLNDKNIPKENITIGLITDVGPGDYTDGIWTIAGKKITKHGAWTESLNTGLLGYYSFNVSAVDDSGKGNDCKGNAVYTSTGGALDGYYNFVSTSNHNLTCGDADYRVDKNITVSFWVRHDGGTSSQVIGMPKNMALSGNNRVWIFYTENANPIHEPALDTNIASYLLKVNESEGAWQHVIMWYNGTSFSIQVNGTLIDSISASGVLNAEFTGSPNLTMGTYLGTTQSWWDGGIDEVGLWNRELTASERTDLWGGGTPPTFNLNPDSPPTITLNSPENNSVSNVINISLNCSASDDDKIQNVSLYINENLNFTKIDGVTNFTELNTTLNFAVGSYNWSCRAYDNATQQGNGTYRYFNITTIPAISYLTPTPDNATNQTTNSFIVNVSLTETYFNNLTFQLWNTTGGVENATYTNSIRWHNFSSLPNGNYTYNATVWTTTGEKNTTNTRSLFIDSVNPNTNVTYPYDFVSFHQINKNLTINWSVSDTSLSSCIVSFDNGKNNQSVACLNNNITVNITSINNNSFMVWANDSFGNSNISTRTWDYKVFITSTQFSSTTTEGATESFIINFTRASSLQISTVNLIYNSSTYSSTYSLSGRNVTASNNLAIPNQADLSIVPFYWSITMSDNSIINTSSYNQTINTLQVDDCTTYTNVLYNFTSFDEETKTKLLNTTIEIQFQLYDLNKTTNILNFSKLYTEINPARICLNSSILTTVNYSIDAVVRYTSNSSGNPYAEEYYNILKQTIGNTTVPKNIALYNLLSTDSTEFQLTFRDATYSLAPNILVYLYRQYVADNDFKIVELPLTDSNGQTILHMVRNNIVYNIVLVDKNGNILATFNKVIAFCQDYTIGACTINLNALSDSSTVYNYLTDVGISYTTPTYSNSTKLVSFSFTSKNLSAIPVSTTIIRNNAFGNRTVCTNSLTSATGTITCNVSSVSESDRFLFVDIYVNGDLKAQTTIDLEASTSGFGIVIGAFYGFLLILLLITLFMDDKQTLIISLGIGWAVILALGLIKGALIGAVSGGIWLIICIIIFLWKLKKEEMG